MKKLTHDDLVKKAGSFLRNRFKGDCTDKDYIPSCSFTLSEFVTLSSTIPDVVGFNYYCSVMIECKTSRSDFKRDFKKSCVHHPKAAAIGNFRFYFTPPDLIKVEELPQGWGLIETDGRKYNIKAKANYRESHAATERQTLFSLANRIANKKDVSKYLK